ncbi:hypothetical protein GUJ93_ZPchr0012g18997 [Zizania palustris]|uniref:Uncharacterized protein n=1 Tax=Zizania palustris TaxID=103762 RepID=A0A8J5WU56_ZIZPA|nr:hypothetical protein GUJ93_ZPchr0012g18997 [Zizania palustris]
MAPSDKAKTKAADDDGSDNSPQPAAGQGRELVVARQYTPVVSGVSNVLLLTSSNYEEWSLLMEEVWEAIRKMRAGSERVRDAKAQTLRSEYDQLRHKPVVVAHTPAPQMNDDSEVAPASPSASPEPAPSTDMYTATPVLDAPERRAVAEGYASPPAGATPDFDLVGEEAPRR